MRLSSFNTDKVASTDRAVAGTQPDNTSPSGGGSPGGTPTNQAELPTYQNAGTVPYQVALGAPVGAGGAYNVTVANPTGGTWVTVQKNQFPYTLIMTNATTTFTLYAGDSDKTPSYPDTQSWNSLFL